MSNPRWLVLAEDGRLYAYFTRDILSIDIALRSSEAIKLYELVPGGFNIKYGPVSVDAFIKASKTIAEPLKARLTSELFDEEDPTPYCTYCNAKSSKNCDCGPIAKNN